jgi:hypothetical protein
MRLLHTLLAVPSLLIAPATLPSASPPAPPNACTETAKLARKARILELKSEHEIALGKCANITDPKLRDECEDEADDLLDAGLEEAQEQYQARLALCNLVGGGPYDPAIDPKKFVSGVKNPLFPQVPGTNRTYVKHTAKGTEVVKIEVTKDIQEILGVKCVVVRDTVTLNGELVEDTLDRFAQDVAGNVWYFGELAKNYVDGELDNLDGSWKAGEDGAKPGIVMRASPLVGKTDRQEFLLAEAEDAVTVLALNVSVNLQSGHFKGCLQTEEFTPLEPGAKEHKFFAPGVGLVLSIDLETGEQMELVSVTGK